jgi:DNA-binding NtrC family response regulator
MRRNARTVQFHPQGCDDRRACAHLGRVGNRQGNDRASHSRPFDAARPAIHRDQLRRYSRSPSSIGIFGYERGAFTGANQRKIGRVEAADGGTLFLDEIGDLPLESQASVLRFLQERTVERLGGHAATPVNVRIISATHVDMQAAMIDGRFRADLFHRLCVLQIEEPPLRERGKDIGLLAHFILERFKKDASRRVRGFAPDAIAAINTYAWPGNVRELINRVRRAIVMSDGRQIRAVDLELAEHAEEAPISLARAREAAERQAIELALLRHRGRLGDAAKELGISRVTLYRLLATHALRVAQFPAGVVMEDAPRGNE